MNPTKQMMARFYDIADFLDKESARRRSPSQLRMNPKRRKACGFLSERASQPLRAPAVTLLVFELETIKLALLILSVKSV